MKKVPCLFKSICGHAAEYPTRQRSYGNSLPANNVMKDYHISLSPRGGSSCGKNFTGMQFRKRVEPRGSESFWGFHAWGNDASRLVVSKKNQGDGCKETKAESEDN